MSELPTITHNPASEPQILPRYEFAGPHLTPALVEAVTNHLDNDDTYSNLPYELTKTPEQEQQLKDIRSAVGDFGDDLGVDVRARLPGLVNIHLLDHSGAEAFRRQNNKQSGWKGQVSNTGLIVDTSGSIADTLSFISHETIHHAYQVKIGLRKEGDLFNSHDIRSGYDVAKTQAFHMLNEIVTEYTNTYIKQHYWQNYPSLASHANGSEAYGENMPFGRALVAKVAATLKQSPEEIWRELMLGALTGDMQPLRHFSEALGTDEMRLLADYKISSPEKIKRLEKQLGITTQQEKIAKWYRFPKHSAARVS